MFSFFYVRFLSFFFYSKMVWGAVIVCIIYTTGYKTPLCHSPESTYRCGCTVYQHMYCNKISFACMAPNWSLETSCECRRKSLLWVHETWKRRPPESFSGTTGIFSFQIVAFLAEDCHPFVSLSCCSSVSRVLVFVGHRWLFSVYFGWSSSCHQVFVFLNLSEMTDTWFIFLTPPPLYKQYCLAYLCMYSFNASYHFSVENVSTTQTQAM